MDLIAGDLGHIALAFIIFPPDRFKATLVVPPSSREAEFAQRRAQLAGVTVYKLAADQGNALALYSRGRFHEERSGGLPKYEREAARLFKLAADQGRALTQVPIAKRTEPKEAA